MAVRAEYRTSEQRGGAALIAEWSRALLTWQSEQNAGLQRRGGVALIAEWSRA